MRNSSRETVSAGISSLFICIIVTVIFLFLNYINIFGYLNPGNNFNAFPLNTDREFKKALDFIKDAPFSKQSVLEKWNVPIRLRYEGNFSEKDITALNEIINDFNTVSGFPGIVIVNSGENVFLSYITKEQFVSYKDKYSADADYTSFCTHSSSNGVINSGAVVIYCEGTQGYRNSTVLHEFTHLVGFYNHTDFRNSILNKTGPVESMSPTDLLAFIMIYNPEIKPLSTYDTIYDYYQNAKIADYEIINESKVSAEYPTLLKIVPFVTAVLLIIVFFPVRKGKKTSLMLIRLFIALAVCLLFSCFLKRVVPAEFINSILSLQ